MLDVIPQQYHLLFGIGALILLLLLITGFAQRFQAYQLEKQAALKRILRGIQQIEDIQQKLEGSALPGALQVVLCKEALARYMTISQIHRRFENIGPLINQAQKKLAVAQSVGERAVTRPADRETRNRLVNGLGNLIIFLQEQKSIAGLSETERRNYIQRLAVMRIEYVDLFHSEEAIELARQQAWNDAGAQLKEALVFMQTYAGSDEQSRAIYDKFSRYYRQVLNRQVPGTESQPQQPVSEPDAKDEELNRAQTAGAMS